MEYAHTERGLHNEILITFLWCRRVLNLEYRMFSRGRGNYKGGVHLIAPTLSKSSYQDNHYVLVTPKLTNTQSKSTKGILTMKTTETLPKSNQPTYPILSFLSGESLAKLSALLEKEQDLTTPEAHSSLTSLGFSKTKDPDIWYSKTSRVYLVMTVAKLSRRYLGFSPTWGMTLNGKYLTAKTSEFPKTESASSLSDILEENVEEKYFLSQVSAENILKRL